MAAAGSRYGVLFEAVRIGPKLLRNRFVQVPHCSGWGSDHPGSQARMRAVKAEGGWAAVCTEFATVHPEADRAPYGAVRLWDDDDVRNLVPLCDEVHAFGALVGIELGHAGPGSAGRSREAPSGATSVPSDSNPSMYARAMDRSEIRELHGFFAAAARRAVAAGFDIVWVHAGYSLLPIQFLSPYYNSRTDDYGGSFENRARFTVELLESVREAVGDDAAIALRFALEGGIELDESLSFIRMVDHLVDMWDLQLGTLAERHRDTTPSRLHPEGYQLKWTSRAREATVKPIVGVGRFTSPDRMVEVVKSGAYDLIGGVRPSIADPFLPRKIESGTLDEIRECIGCNICLERSLGVLHIACTQNATVGEEYRRGWHPERFTVAANADRRVLVIGAGAAGMECAVVLGKRGMSGVTLVDGSDEIGGYTGLVSRLPGLAEWRRVVAYRETQLSKLSNVEVLTNTSLSPEGAAGFEADIIVVATGATWSRVGVNHVTQGVIPGVELAHVLTPEDILNGRVDDLGPRVLVYDCDGYFMGVGMAEVASAAGRAVDLCSPLSSIAPFLDETLEGPETRKALLRRGVRLRPSMELVSLGPSFARLRNLAQLDDETEAAYDSVILVTAREPRDGLYRVLRSEEHDLAHRGVEAVYAIGDCVAPRQIADCVFDGHRLGREIDSPNPRRPLPYIRERRLWGDTSNADYERTDVRT